MKLKRSALFLFLLALPLVAQTKISLTQLPDCVISGTTPTNTPILLALVPSPNGTSQFACYTLTGVSITAANGATPASINIPSAVVPVFVDNETPAGAINGTNAAFTLANTPAPATSLLLFRNGLLQCAVACAGTPDYTLSGGVATFSANSIPQSGDSLLAVYRH